MTIVFFKAEPGSNFNELYFMARKEDEKFRKKAVTFIKRKKFKLHKVRTTEALQVLLTPREVKKYKQHLCKHPDEDGFYTFRKNCDFAKEWRYDIYCPINHALIAAMRVWWPRCGLLSGNCNLFDVDGVLYGYMESNLDMDDLTLPDGAIEITREEYMTMENKYRGIRND